MKTVLEELARPKSEVLASSRPGSGSKAPGLPVHLTQSILVGGFNNPDHGVS
jgi:hypothetical protein